MLFKYQCQQAIFKHIYDYLVDDYPANVDLASLQHFQHDVGVQVDCYTFSKFTCTRINRSSLTICIAIRNSYARSTAGKCGLCCSHAFYSSVCLSVCHNRIVCVETARCIIKLFALPGVPTNQQGVSFHKNNPFNF